MSAASVTLELDEEETASSPVARRSAWARI